MDIYRQAKFSRDPSRGFFPPYARNCASKCLLGFFFGGGGSSNDLQPRRLNRFSRVIRQTTRFRARMCFSGLEDNNLTFTPRNSRKTAIFGPILTGQFSTENRFTMGDCMGVLSCKLPLIVADSKYVVLHDTLPHAHYQLCL